VSPRIAMNVTGIGSQSQSQRRSLFPKDLHQFGRTTTLLPWSLPPPVLSFVYTPAAGKNGGMVRLAERRKRGRLVASLEWHIAVVLSSFSPGSTRNVLIEVRHDFL